jgi:hypothetical protein
MVVGKVGVFSRLNPLGQRALGPGQSEGNWLTAFDTQLLVFWRVMMRWWIWSWTTLKNYLEVSSPGFAGLVKIVYSPWLLGRERYWQHRNPDDEGNEMTRPLGLVVVRGTLLVFVSPVDGSEVIANPFVQAEDW